MKSIIPFIVLIGCDEPKDEDFTIDNTPKVIFNYWVDGYRDIYTVNLDGTNLSRLTTNPGEDIMYSYSSDGNDIVFVSRRSHRAGFNSRSRLGIYSMKADGRDQTRLTDDYYRTSMPSISPDGSKIMFTADSLLGGSRLILMDSDGSNRTIITPEWGDYYHAQFNPNGSEILYMIQYEPYRGEIVTADMNGNNLQYLTSNLDYSTSPRFSPDGSKILFFSPNDIHVMDSNGENQLQITDGYINSFSACFTPNSDKIIFSSSRYGIHEDYEIYMINSDGTGEIRLTNDPHDDEYAEVSPDGTKIVFTRGEKIYMMDIDGSNPVNLLGDEYHGAMFPKFRPSSENL